MLPITETSNYWYGHRLISQPFCEYGGLLIDPRLSGDEIKLLVETMQRHLAATMPRAVRKSTATSAFLLSSAGYSSSRIPTVWRRFHCMRGQTTCGRRPSSTRCGRR